MRDNKGITLITLVIMIIIILILASVGTTTGLDVIRQSKYNRAVAEMKVMQIKVNEMYEEYKSGDLILDNIGTDIPSSLQTKSETALIAIYGNLSNINTSDFKYYSADYIKNTLDVDGVENDYLVNIKTREVVLIDGTKNDGEMYYSLSQIDDEQFNVEYINPGITYSPDGGMYVLPKNITSENNLNMNIALSLQDIPNNMSANDLRIKYSWSTSKDTEPSEWIQLPAGTTTITEDENSDITEAGDYYLWTKIEDNNGKALNIIVSKKFVVKREYDVKVALNFDANGGTTEIAQKNLYNHENYGELPTSTRKGYVFKGWYTEKTGGTKIEPTSNLELDEENLPPTQPQSQTLYARWEETSLMATSTATATSAFLGTSITRDKIKRVSFATSIQGHDIDNTTCWDVSDKQNGGVRLWVSNTDENENVDIVIGQNGGVYANPISEYLFSYIGNTINATIDLKDFNTSRTTTMYSMFYSCKNIETLDVNGFNTSKVENMRSMFNECNNLTTLDVSGFDTSKVTTMRGMFRYCNNLTELDVNGIDTSKVTDMYSMFYNCNKLTTLDVSGFNTSQVTNMYYMFGFCRNLSTIDVSRFDTSNVINMGRMFYTCPKITSLDLSNFDTNKVNFMLMMFMGDRLLQTIYVSEKWNIEKVINTPQDNSDISVERQLMFYNCMQLVGGSGTTYSASNENDLTYAHIDEGQTNPGYLTYKQPTVPTPTNNSTSTTSSVSGNQSTSLSGMQAIAKAKKGTTIIFGILVFILSGIIIWRIKKLIKK